MKSKLVMVGVTFLLLVPAAMVTASAPAAGARPLSLPFGQTARCTNGVSDRINGRVVCIHVGGRCVSAHNAKYRARGYACVNGRLRRLKKVTVSVADASAAEGNSGSTTESVEVTLSAASTSPVTVAYATADGTAKAGSDYVAASGTLTFRPGERSKTIPISVAGETSIEADETLTVTLSNASNATIARATATVTITNDDTAVPVAAGAYKGATQNGNFVFFTLRPDRTITGFRVNDLPETCDPYGRITGGIDLGDSVFHVADDGRVVAEGAWTGSDVQGDVEWTSFYAKIVGAFTNPATISGTIIERDELNYQGQHFKCASGEITWSATRQG
jgi:Calx-beta domain-containing protein